MREFSTLLQDFQDFLRVPDHSLMLVANQPIQQLPLMFDVPLGFRNVSFRHLQRRLMAQPLSGVVAEPLHGNARASCVLLAFAASPLRRIGLRVQFFGVCQSLGGVL